MNFTITFYVHVYGYFHLVEGGHPFHDCMVVGFATTNAINAYHH